MAFKVLVAEDDDDIRFALDLLLSMEGYVVVTAQDGEQALKLAKNENPDIIITDISMPKLTGVELTRLIRQDRCLAHKKVLAISAYGDKPRQAILDAGANCFMAKPIDINKLLPKIAYLAGNTTGH
jgi:two-component system, OmpR family, alkaline phosphatase synthesis response regulator PhoP